MYTIDQLVAEKMETQGISILTSIDATSVCHNTKDDETDKQSDLQAGKPKLDLSIVFDSEEVCCDAQNQEYCNVNSKLLARKLASRSRSCVRE